MPMKNKPAKRSVKSYRRYLFAVIAIIVLLFCLCFCACTDNTEPGFDRTRQELRQPAYTAGHTLDVDDINTRLVFKNGD